MYDVGYKHLTNIDISETVVTHMNQRNAERRPQLTFQQVDATQTPYEDASYQACLDKGTLDAMASEEEGELARRMLTEVRNFHIAYLLSISVSKSVLIGDRLV